MLLHFGEALTEQISSAIDKSDSIVHALQNVAQARVQGDHIITGDAGVLDAISNHARLSETTRGVFQRISEEQPQVGGLRNRLIAHVLIDSVTRTHDSHKRAADGRLFLHVPLDRFQRNDVVQPAFLIAENLNDCKLYLSYCRWVLRRYFGGRLPTHLSAVFIPGGGDTTGKLVQHFSDEQRYLAFSICDSDRSFPAAPLGETAKKCQSAALSDLSHHLTVKVRSIENLLSAEQIEAVLNTAHERRPLLSNLEAIRHLQEGESWWHLPMKEGIRELVGPPRRGSFHEYWNGIARGTVAIEGYLFPGISAKLLSWTVDHIESHEPASLDAVPHLQDIWKELAEWVASWFCATQPLRA